VVAEDGDDEIRDVGGDLFEFCEEFAVLVDHVWLFADS
jgi:hypothetical protein